MSLLDKKQALYKNNGANLEPIEVDLVQAYEDDDFQKDATVKLIPMTRFQIREFFKKAEVNEDEEGKTSVVSTKDSDAELIKTHIVEPAFSDKELKFLKPKITRNLVLTILKASEQDISGLIQLTTLSKHKENDSTD